MVNLQKQTKHYKPVERQEFFSKPPHLLEFHEILHRGGAEGKLRRKRARPKFVSKGEKLSFFRKKRESLGNTAGQWRARTAVNVCRAGCFRELLAKLAGFTPDSHSVVVVESRQKYPLGLKTPSLYPPENDAAGREGPGAGGPQSWGSSWSVVEP